MVINITYRDVIRCSRHGNLLSDQNKGISLEYNVLNLPVKVTSSGGTAEYSYSASGEKLRRTVTSGTTPTYHYYLKDHLGNNRVVLKQNGTVEQVLHYYPYGDVFAEGVGTASSGQPYRYNGKELENGNGLNLYDYGARYQDPQLGRFISIDPLCEENYSVSPYHYANNNPINRIDLFGLFDDWVQKENGSIYWDEHATSKETTKNGEKYLGKAALIINGFNDEKLGNGNILGGEGGKHANGVLYTPNKEIVEGLVAYTMTSDVSQNTPIDDGEYIIKRRSAGLYSAPNKSDLDLVQQGIIPKHYQVLNTDSSDGIGTYRGETNLNADKRLGPINSYQKFGIFIHSTLRSTDKVGSKTSQGCILLNTKSYNIFDKEVTPLGNGYPIYFILNRK